MTPINLCMIFMLHAFLGLASLATPVLKQSAAPAGLTEDMSVRSTNTCADPSLARPVFQGFSGSVIGHILRFHWTLVDANTQLSNGLTTWTPEGPVFKGWPSQQPFTVPLFQVNTATDFIFMVGTDAQTPPVVSGFSTGPIVAWVYSTAVCDSVPLMSAFFAAKSDHYYTTDPEEHAALLAVGWTDSGVVAFVLPLPSL